MPNEELPAFGPGDVELLLRALDGLTEAIQRLNRTALDPAARTNAEQSLPLLRSAAAKLKKRSGAFTLDEARMMYLALAELRGGLNDLLDGLSPAAADLRTAAQEDLRAANGLLRRLRSFFRGLGVDIDARAAQDRLTL